MPYATARAETRAVHRFRHEPNLLAISVGRIFTKRSKVMVFDGGYQSTVFGFTGRGSADRRAVSIMSWRRTSRTWPRSAALIDRHGADLALVVLEPNNEQQRNLHGPGDPRSSPCCAEATTQVGALLILESVDDIGHVAARPAAGTRHQAGSDNVRRMSRRRHVVRRVRRARRRDGFPRPSPTGRAAGIPAPTTTTCSPMSAGLVGLTKFCTYRFGSGCAECARRCVQEQLNALCPCATMHRCSFRGFQLDAGGAAHPRCSCAAQADAAKGDAKLKELFSSTCWRKACGSLGAACFRAVPYRSAMPSSTGLAAAVGGVSFMAPVVVGGSLRLNHGCTRMNTDMLICVHPCHPWFRIQK